MRWPSHRVDRLSREWGLLREQLSGTPFSLDDLPERLSKVSMPKVALPKIGLPQRTKEAEGETAADVIALFDIHEEEARAQARGATQHGSAFLPDA